MMTLDLPTLASQAAIEFDRAIRNLPTSFEAAHALGLLLDKILGENECPKLPEFGLLGRALNEIHISTQQTVDGVRSSLEVVTECLKELPENANLIELRDFCISLTDTFIGANFLIEETRPPHRFRR